MAQPYVGEIRMFAGNFQPAGWMFCEGQLLPISDNETLFQLIGTTYGGDGEQTFALPDLRGRTPLHFGGGFVLAETGGVETVTLAVSQMPSHTHPLLAASTPATATNPVGNLGAQPSSKRFYGPMSVPGAMAPNSGTSAGGSQPHENMQPYLCVSYIISLFGIFPSPS